MVSTCLVFVLPLTISICNMQSFNSLNAAVIQWAEDKGILEHGSLLGQHKLLLTEVMELYDAINTGDIHEEMSELGDCLVVLLIIAKMRELDPVDCLHAAYEKINGRKGKMNSSGVFVKEN